MRRRDKWLMVIALIVVVGLAIRAALPTLIRDYVNYKLQALEGYDGHIDDVHLSLIRGAYAVDNIKIVKTGSGQPVPFFSSDRVSFSVEWPSLLHGSLVSEGVFLNPNLNFVQEMSSRAARKHSLVFAPTRRCSMAVQPSSAAASIRSTTSRRST